MDETSSPRPFTSGIIAVNSGGQKLFYAALLAANLQLIPGIVSAYEFY
jgi:hypothetical protein